MSGGFRKFISGPFGWMLLILVVLEVGASYVNPYRDAPTAEEYPRNAYFRRGWPEYLDTGTVPDVVLLGNSQAFGREIAAEDIFPNLLGLSLGDRNPPVTIENWSVYGRTPADLELLLLEVARRQPTLAVYLSTVSDYAQFDHEYSLAYTQHDTNLLIADPGIWRWLPGTRVGERLKIDDFTHRVVLGWFDLARLRTHLLDHLAERMRPNEYRLLMGHKRAQDNLVYEQPDQGRRPYAFETGFRLNKRPDRDLMNRRLEMLPEFLDDLQALTVDRGTALLWVWQPYASGILSPQQLREANYFYREATGELRRRGFTVVDLRNLVPVENYFTVSHFDEFGQLLLAARLEEMILDAL